MKNNIPDEIWIDKQVNGELKNIWHTKKDMHIIQEKYIHTDKVNEKLESIKKCINSVGNWSTRTELLMMFNWLSNIIFEEKELNK
jgi:hypothetical protein